MGPSIKYVCSKSAKIGPPSPLYAHVRFWHYPLPPLYAFSLTPSRAYVLYGWPLYIHIAFYLSFFVLTFSFFLLMPSLNETIIEINRHFPNLMKILS